MSHRKTEQGVCVHVSVCLCQWLVDPRCPLIECQRQMRQLTLAVLTTSQKETLQYS